MWLSLLWQLYFYQDFIDSKKQGKYNKMKIENYMEIVNKVRRILGYEGIYG